MVNDRATEPKGSYIPICYKVWFLYSEFVIWSAIGPSIRVLRIISGGSGRASGSDGDSSSSINYSIRHRGNITNGNCIRNAVRKCLGLSIQVSHHEPL